MAKNSWHCQWHRTRLRDEVGMANSNRRYFHKDFIGARVVELQLLYDEIFP
jgi:hypothetical protein